MSALAAIALLSIAVAVAVVAGVGVALALRRARRLAALRRIVGVARDDALPDAVRALAEARSDAESGRDRAVADLAGLADLLSIGILRLGPQLEVELANEAAHHFLGHEPGGLIGRSITTTVAEGELERLVRRAAGGRAASGEWESQDPPRTLVGRARRATTDGLWVVLEDVTELRRLQRIRSEFVDNLAHELRTPLTNLGLLSETLARDVEGDVVTPRIRDRAVKIDIETGHLAQMVNELLDLTRIESGQPLLLDEVDLAALVTATVERLRLFAERQGVVLVAEVSAGLPPVRGDEDRLGQVIVNLVHNAVKFSPQGAAVTVRARAEREPLGPEPRDVVSISVEDHGVGIPAAQLSRIFERFYKVDKARVRRAGGTGLGLAIARHIVESHGGRIGVSSVEGQGSVFTFVIPATVPRAAGSARPTPVAG